MKARIAISLEESRSFTIIPLQLTQTYPGYANPSPFLLIILDA
jgi:hypothetical protein